MHQLQNYLCKWSKLSKFGRPVTGRRTVCIRKQNSRAPTGTDVHCCMCCVYVNKTHSKCISVWNDLYVFKDMFRHSWVIITDSRKNRREALQITPKCLKCKLQDRQWTYNATL